MIDLHQRQEAGKTTQHKAALQGRNRTNQHQLCLSNGHGRDFAAALKKKKETLGPLLTQRDKIIQSNGTQLQRLLTRSDLWSGGDCGRPTCTQEDEKTPDCRQINITYRTTCRLCSCKGDHTAYIGESSKSLMNDSWNMQRTPRR